MGPEGPHINLTCLCCFVCVCFPFLWCVVFFVFFVVVVVVGFATDPPDNQPKNVKKTT